MEVMRRSLCLSGSTFFGLTPDYRKNVFQQVHEIVFHGKGGYDWGTVYNMPIWLRKYTFKTIEEFYDKEQAAHKEAMNKSNNVQEVASEATIPKGPDIKPNYSTRTSRS
jgi:hypothetical protein